MTDAEQITKAINILVKICLLVNENMDCSGSLHLNDTQTGSLIDFLDDIEAVINGTEEDT
ncbi:MAG: hypothetical protein LBR80_08340 [Deltaproteobacteria bacterium]|jgi:hypothetical protein|nr:hypothetical protein [Deltaproteobacteria bacterium]